MRKERKKKGIWLGLYSYGNQALPLDKNLAMEKLSLVNVVQNMPQPCQRSLLPNPSENVEPSGCIDFSYIESVKK